MKNPKPDKASLIILLALLGCLIPTIYFCTCIWIDSQIKFTEQEETIKILRDSIGKQSRKEIEQDGIIKSICKTPPVMQTESYKRGKRKQDSIKQLKTND